MKEKRNFQTQIRLNQQEEKESKKVVGYAAVFNDHSEELWGFIERIDPMAFADTDMSDVRALFNHDSNHLLARTLSKTLSLKVDERGLQYEFELPDTTAGRDLRVLMERGDINQSSFGFEIEEDKWDERGKDELPLRTITKIKRLFDVSVVTYPAYPSAEVALRSKEAWEKTLEKTSEESGESNNIKTPLLDKVEEIFKIKNIQV